MTSTSMRLLGAALLTLTVTGCASSGTPTAPASPTPAPTAEAGPDEAAPDAGMPSVADCWQEDDYVTASEWDSWQGASNVDCAEPHNSITYAVSDLDPSLPYPSPTDEEDGTAWSDDLVAAVGDACTRSPRLQPLAGSRYKTWVYLSTYEQWQEGEAWVRCDVTMRAVGPLAGQQLEALPASLDALVAAYEADPLVYRTCIDTPRAGDAAGPLEDPTDSTYVACDGPHQWEFVGWFDLSSSLDAEYPGRDTVLDEVRLICTSIVDAKHWWAYFPDEAEWASGEYTGSCYGASS